MMVRSCRPIGFLLACAILSVASASSAEETARIRGQITGVEGHTLTVVSREGATVRLTLTDDAKISAVLPAELQSIAPGSYIGAAAVPEADGRLLAQEIVIFPPAMKGVGEGHRPWDLTPDSTMTNAAVEATVGDVSARVLTLVYKEGKKELEVPPGIPIVTLAPGDAGLLVPGAWVFLTAKKADDGALTTDRVAVGKDGLKPPM